MWQYEYAAIRTWTNVQWGRVVRKCPFLCTGRSAIVQQRQLSHVLNAPNPCQDSPCILKSKKIFPARVALGPKEVCMAIHPEAGKLPDPATLENISNSTFRGCSVLTTVTFTNANTLNPNRSLETELALFLMTAIRKMWLYIVGS